MTSSEFADKIKQRRKALKITQNDLYELSGISVATISAIENAHIDPSLGTMARLCDVLGLEITVKAKGA